MTVKLGVNGTDANGDYEEFKSLLATYGIIFLINILYEVIAFGGVANFNFVLFADGLIRALFITLVIYAGNKGIEWKSRE